MKVKNEQVLQRQFWRGILVGMIVMAGGIAVLLLLLSRLNSPMKQQVEINAAADWVTVGEVCVGQTVSLEYVSGTWRASPPEDYDAGGGDSYICNADYCIEPVIGTPKGGLVGRIGSQPAFWIGNQLTFIAEQSGLLQLTMNDPGRYDNSGSVTMALEIAGACR